MNAATNKLSDEEVKARRQLVLMPVSNNAMSEDDFNTYIENLSILVHIPDELVAEATQAFVSARARVDNNEAATTTNQQQQAHNPYLRDAQKKQARIEHNKRWGSLAGGTSTTISNATSKNKKNNGAGRPVNSKNKPGHKAGGDRKSNKFQNDQQMKRNGNNNQNIASFMVGGNNNNNHEQGGDDGGGGGGGGGSGGGGGGGDESDSDDDDNDEGERRRKIIEKEDMARALKSLDMYTKSFTNGTIDTNPLEEEESSDNESDDEDETDMDDNNNSRNRPSYKPKAGAVKDYLDGIIQSIRDEKFDWTKSAWIPPPYNPLSKSLGSTAKPDRHYIGNTWVYVFDPMKQYPHLMPQTNTCTNPKCKSTDTKFNGNWDVRPFHWWDITVYVIHCRVLCKKCGCTFPTCSAASVANIPTTIAEQFPFMLPNERGPGVYIPMLLMMVFLMPSSILYGTFTKVINMIKRFRFAQAHVSYLDLVFHWLNVQPPPHIESKIPTPFSSFEDQTGYCGVELRPSLLSRCLRTFMSVMEPYMQSSFQLANDIGASTDDSHKLTKHITVSIGRNKVKPFTDTFTMISHSGKVCLSIFKPTKSVDELREIIPNHAKVRENVGHKDLLRLEGDNAAHDSVLLHSASPSLYRDVVPYEDNTDNPRYEISKNDFRYITTVSGLDTYACALISYIQEKLSSGTKTIKIGLDTEFDNGGLRVIAIAIEGYSPGCLIHPYGWRSFNDTMKKILELDCILVIGCNLGNDISLLYKEYGIRVKAIRDNRRYCLHDNASQKTGLSDLAATYLGVHVDKSFQRESFNVQPDLALPMQLYAYGDALISLRIDDAISSRLTNSESVLEQHPPDLQPGMKVMIKIGGKEAATAKIDFIGDYGSNAGESRNWGSLYVGAKKAKVKLIKVLAPGALVPFQHCNWGPTRLTLGDVFNEDPEGVIVVHTRQIHKRLDAASTTTNLNNDAASSTTNVTNNNTNASKANNTTIEEETNEESEVADQDEIQAAATNEGVDADLGIEQVGDNTCNSDDIEDDEDEIRSRAKSDIWHEFHNTPLKRDCPASPSIFILLRVATQTINEVEEDRVKHVLASKGIVNFDEHFFFHKEWWYKRVRMPPRNAKVAGENLMTLLNYLQTNEVFKEYVTDDLVKHIKGWARRCLGGRYDDLPDVEMYKHDGYDSNGLDLWLRYRGSRAENFHQKMHVAVGPYGIGVESAHYLQVILAYFYNVNAGIRRCDEPDFGHPMLDLEDRIQSRIADIWGVIVFPNRVNVSEYKPLDFTSVGVAPLSFDERYVDKGEPGKNLKVGSGMWFLAKRHGVQYPPLPPHSKEEFAMIRKFCAEHPNPKTADIQQLCMDFKAKANGTTINTKLPTMVTPAIKRWKINQQAELLRLQTKESFEEVFNKFRSDKISLPRPQVNNTRRRRQSQKTPAPTTNDDEALVELPPVFTQPLSAPGQTQHIPLSSQAKPTESLSAAQRRDKNYVGAGRSRKCSWYPFCGEAIICGGIQKNSCSKFGTNGTHIDERPSEEELKQRKREIKTQKQKERRKGDK